MMPQVEREGPIAKLLRMYREDPDAGIHGAAEWLLRRWGQQKELAKIDAPLMTGKVEGQRQWYLTGQGQTMVVIPGPVEFLMGSPPTEKDREPKEAQHRRTIKHGFAISAKKVTVEQFRRICEEPDHSEMPYCPEPDCPIIAVTWYEAASYCNWLSEHEGIPEDQWCYEPNDEGEYAEGMTIRSRYLDLS